MLAVIVKTITPVVAPVHSKRMLRRLIEKYNLNEHLDRIFFRVSIGGKPHIWIPGRAVRYAIRNALYDLGEEKLPRFEMLKIFGMVFKQEDVVIEHFFLKPKGQKSSLMCVEIVPPDSMGLILFGTREIPDIIKKVAKLQIGGLRTHGYGWVEIFWDKTTEVNI